VNVFLGASHPFYNKNWKSAHASAHDFWQLPFLHHTYVQVYRFDSDQKNAERKVKQQQDKVEEAKERLAQFPPEDEILKQEEELGKKYRRQSQH